MVNKPISAILSIDTEHARGFRMKCTWSHITAIMMQALAFWSLTSICPWSMCSYCTFECMSSCVFVCVYAYIFLHIWSTPSVLPQCLHPNHNYNVISRVRQRPCCCFTSSSSSLLWISNALMLSSKSCTVRSQTHVPYVCVSMCFVVVGGGGGGVVQFNITFLFCLWQKKPAAGPQFWKYASYPSGLLLALSKQDKLTSLSAALCRVYVIFLIHVT